MAIQQTQAQRQQAAAQRVAGNKAYQKLIGSGIDKGLVHALKTGMNSRGQSIFQGGGSQFAKLFKQAQGVLSTEEFEAFLPTSQRESFAKNFQSVLTAAEKTRDTSTVGRNQNKDRLGFHLAKGVNAAQSALNVLGAGNFDTFDEATKQREVSLKVAGEKIQSRVGKSKVGGGTVSQREADLEMAAVNAEGNPLEQKRINAQRRSAGFLEGRKAGTFGTSEEALASGQAAAASTLPGLKGDALSTVSELRGRGLSDDVVRAGLIRQGVSEADADKAILNAPEVDLGAIRAANAQQAAMETFSVSDQAQLQIDLGSNDPQVRQAAIERMNQAVALGSTSGSFQGINLPPGMQFSISDSTNLGTQQLIDDATESLGASAQPFIDLIKAEGRIGTEAADAAMFSKIRSLQLGGEITKAQANSLKQNIEARREIANVRVNTELRQMTDEINANITDLDRRTDNDIVDLENAKDGAIGSTQARLARMGIINSSDSINIVNRVAGEYDRMVNRAKEERFSKVQELMRAGTNAIEKASIAKMELDQTFNESITKVDNDTRSQLFAIQSKIWDTETQRTNAIAKVRMNQINKISGLMGHKRDLEERLAGEVRAEQRQIRTEGRAAARQRAAAARVAARQKVSGSTPAQISQENKLRADLLKRSGAFIEVRDAYNKVETSAAAETAAGDLSLVFNYMKILDPGSVVRESEFKSAEAAKSWLTQAEDGGIIVPSNVRTAIQKADPSKKGAFLLDAQRDDFLARADDLFVAQSDTQQTTVDAFSGLVDRQGLDRESVVLDLDPSDRVIQTEEQSTSYMDSVVNDVVAANSFVGPIQPEQQLDADNSYLDQLGF